MHLSALNSHYIKLVCLENPRRRTKLKHTCFLQPQEMEKSPANHFLILFRDSSCQFRGVYTMNTDSQELVRLAGVGPRTISSAQVESIYKYSSDRKQFSTIPSKTMGMSVDAFTIPGHLWQGGGGVAGGGSRRASITKKAVISK